MGRDSMFENICIIHCWSWSNMWFLEKAHLEMYSSGNHTVYIYIYNCPDIGKYSQTFEPFL